MLKFGHIPGDFKLFTPHIPEGTIRLFQNKDCSEILGGFLALGVLCTVTQNDCYLRANQGEVFRGLEKLNVSPKVTSVQTFLHVCMVFGTIWFLYNVWLFVRVYVDESVCVFLLNIIANLGQVLNLYVFFGLHSETVCEK